MSSSAGSSALVHIINPSIVDTTDMRNNANSACLPNNDITINMDSASFDTTFNVIIGMIVIATLTGSTLLAIFSAFFIIIALKATTPEVTDTDQQATLTADTAIPTTDITNSELINTLETTLNNQDIDTSSGPNNATSISSTKDAAIDNEPSELVVPVDKKVRIHHHARPTADFAEVTTPATTSANDTKSTYSDNDYFGGLAFDIFDFHSLHEYLEEDQMWLAHMPHPSPAITSAPEATAIVQMNKIVKAARPARKTSHNPIFNAKLSTIYEEEEEEEIEEDEEDIEHPRSSSHEADSSFNSLADEEDFSESEEDIIAFAKKVNRLCDELEKVECFSDSQEHASTIALAQDPEATFQQWDEEDLEAFSDSEDDAVALAKKIEVDTRPSPPDSPTPPTPEGTGARFTESGFLIETPDHSPVSHTTVGLPFRTPEGKLLQTPSGIQIRKNIFSSPDQETPHHIRKVSNETNTSEDTNGSRTTATEPASPTTVYSSPDNITEYQAMAGFTVALSAKKATAINFDPIAQPGDDIEYDRKLLRDETPSPSPPRHRSPASDRSTSSNDSNKVTSPSGSEDMSTPYDYTHDSDDSEIVAVLKRPGGASYAKMSCGNWFFLNDDGSLDELNWREYEELIAFIVGDKTMRNEVQTQEEELPLPWVPWDDEPEILPEVNVEEELPLPWVPWDEPEALKPESEPKLEDQHSKSTTEVITNDINEDSIAEVAEAVINSDQPDEKWFKAEEMPPRWFVMEHIRCPGDEISYYAEYVRGSDDRWYFRLDGPEYRPLDARELRWFLNWRASTRPLTYIVELEEEECF
ncbi:hypothetical protein GE21DRAFT_2421 [Neurospora crassa]|uniref:Uncharacterized protein n=1 Tax=Neurospora crassa (strain ATCC 24698 / 74-OR23-1A / CBS 708.71 / DSM 1257 / FGSC 987) TaxID=367110 RepID=Q7SDB9_NEUCR|nr:hypothetical protein NCU02873 [Neurospora crassa OR74A]EAA34771.3 hypothetical protein NCU02873 [Neurospora crassa OR74A]KHE78697.1 hypothetical protein GE21DRAFT_2421 [Neurospora crassa]|eukprot:XP_964007.3 hypothetical protein NCU02873 [Neurospora crassa OR74A]